MKSTTLLVLLSAALLGTLLSNCANPKGCAPPTVATGPSASSPDWYYKDPASGYTPILEQNVGFNQFNTPTATNRLASKQVGSGQR